MCKSFSSIKTDLEEVWGQENHRENAVMTVLPHMDIFCLRQGVNVS